MVRYGKIGTSGKILLHSPEYHSVFCVATAWGHPGPLMQHWNSASAEFRGVSSFTRPSWGYDSDITSSGDTCRFPQILDPSISTIYWSIGEVDSMGPSALGHIWSLRCANVELWIALVCLKQTHTVGSRWDRLKETQQRHTHIYIYMLYIHNYTHKIRQYTLDIIRSWVWELKTPKVTEWRITELIPMDGASPADKNLWHEAQWNGAPWLWREQLKKTMRTVLRTWRTLYSLYDYCIHVYNVYRDDTGTKSK